MKNFEEWWDKVGQFIFSTYMTKQQSKDVWKAALKWAYGADDVFGVVENIEKELELDLNEDK